MTLTNYMYFLSLATLFHSLFYHTSLALWWLMQMWIAQLIRGLHYVVSGLYHKYIFAKLLAKI